MITLKTLFMTLIGVALVIALVYKAFAVLRHVMMDDIYARPQHRRV